MLWKGGGFWNSVHVVRCVVCPTDLRQTNSRIILPAFLLFNAEQYVVISVSLPTTQFPYSIIGVGRLDRSSHDCPRMMWFELYLESLWQQTTQSEYRIKTPLWYKLNFVLLSVCQQTSIKLLSVLEISSIIRFLSRTTVQLNSRNCLAEKVCCFCTPARLGPRLTNDALVSMRSF